MKRGWFAVLVVVFETAIVLTAGALVYANTEAAVLEGPQQPERRERDDGIGAARRRG